MTQIDDLNALGYTSSAPDFAVPRDGPKPIDEEQISTLEKVMILLEDRKAGYMSVMAIDETKEKSESIRTQIKDNKRMLFHISELQQLILSTINKVKEKQNERNY